MIWPCVLEPQQKVFSFVEGRPVKVLFANKELYDMSKTGFVLLSCVCTELLLGVVCTCLLLCAGFKHHMMSLRIF